VSRDRSGRARSVDEQQADNERDAGHEGIDIIRTYRDPDRSASRYAKRVRDEYRLLLRDIARHEIDVLYLWEPSRGSRKVSEWVELIELAEKYHVVIRVTSHGRTYDPARHRDRKSLLEDAVDAEYESGKTSERVQRTFDASAAAGAPGGKPAYGYRREYDTHSGRLLRQVPDEVTAPVVREIARRVLAGETLHSIAVGLNVRDVPTPQVVIDRRMGRVTEGDARLWNSVKVRKVVATPTIAGWRIHQGKPHAVAAWEPLVSAADHAAILALLADPARLQHRGTEPKYLLSGIALCGFPECGAVMRPFLNRDRMCYACGGKRKGHVVRRLDMVDALVVTHVVQVLADPGLLERVIRAQQERDSTVAEAGREIAHLQEQIRAFEEVAAGGEVPPERFVRVVAGMESRLAEARSRLSGRGILPQVALELAGPRAKAMWNEPRVQEDILLQRQVVRALVRVVVHPSRQPRGVRGFDASTIEIIDL
jgi:DNA invertase Pin-like site-specific DNA recombinase